MLPIVINELHNAEVFVLVRLRMHDVRLCRMAKDHLVKKIRSPKVEKMLPVVENGLHNAQVRVHGAKLCQDDKLQRAGTG